MTRKKKARKNIFLRLILCFMAAYAVIMLVEMQVALYEKRQELEDLRVQYEKQRLDNKDLQRQLAEGVNEDEIERLAREKLDFVAPDELVFIDISGS